MKHFKDKLVILKIGGSVITFKENNSKIVKKENLKRIFREISNAKKKRNFLLIIIHGVGSFGHIISKKFRLNEGYKDNSQIRAITDLHFDLEKLRLNVLKIAKKEKLDVVSFSQSSSWKLSNKNIYRADIDIIVKYLEIGLIPVLHGDILIDNKTKFSILSGDGIVYYLSKKLKPKRVIVGTDVDGIFNENPKINGNAKVLKEINKFCIKNVNMKNLDYVCDVTGGMKNKIEELLKLAECGIESEIINISKPHILEKSLCGEKGLGTIVRNCKI